MGVEGVPTKHHVFLVPGFFGFTHLGAFEYWGHVRALLVELAVASGIDLAVTPVGSHPTSSLLARAERLAKMIRDTADPSAAIHLIGHSSGGLDARLLVSPNVDLGVDVEDVARRVRTVITVATPHRGTPLASFFNNLSGPRLLGTAARLLGRTLGKQRATAEDLPPDARAQLSKFLSEIGRDQALVAQLAPESMELFNATARDRPGVRYACVLAEVPGSRLGARSPISVANRAIFAVMHQLTAKDRGTDGVVPTDSQRWGDVLFEAAADHLDVLGHFDGGPAHVDWFASGSAFTRMHFEELWKNVFSVIEAQAGARQRFDLRWIAIAVGATLAIGWMLWATY